MENSTFIAVPQETNDPEVMKRFSHLLIEKLDIAFSLRDKGFVSKNNLHSNDFRLENVFVRLDGANMLNDDVLVSAQPKPSHLSSNASLSDVINKVNEVIDKLEVSKVFK